MSIALCCCLFRWPPEPRVTLPPGRREQSLVPELGLLGIELCRKCGRENPVWFAPNDVWNVINQTGILCPICFIDEAEKAGLNPTAWELTPERI